MSKNKIDRRESSFKAQDNIEIIMDKIIYLIESNFESSIEIQEQSAGKWTTDGTRAEINFSFDTPYKNIDGKTLVLNFDVKGDVFVSTHKTWLIQIFRDKLIDTTFELMEHVNTANDIHPITLVEFDERRLLQDKAIADCYHISHILQQAIKYLYIQPSKIENLVGLIKMEIKLLRGWRKSEYKKRKAIIKRENGL